MRWRLVDKAILTMTLAKCKEDEGHAQKEKKRKEKKQKMCAAPHQSVARVPSHLHEIVLLLNVAAIAARHALHGSHGGAPAPSPRCSGATMQHEHVHDNISYVL